MTPRRMWRRLFGSVRPQAQRVACWMLCRRKRLPGWFEARSARLAAGAAPLWPLGLGELNPERLLALRQDPDMKWLLSPPPTVAVDRLINFGTEHPGLDVAVGRLLRKADDSELSDALHRAVVLDGDEAQRKFVYTLGVSALSAERLVPEHRRQIFARCFEIVRRPADPYNSSGALISGSARQAAAAILAIDSGFDDDIVEALSDAAVRANVEALAASALKERPEEAFERFASYVAAMAPSAEGAIRFAEDCDADRSSLRPVVRPRPSASRRLLAKLKRLRPRGSFWYVAGVVLPPVAAVGLAKASRHATGALIEAGIDPGVAIAALALLAAVHVLAVQLAAQRLPGPIAAGTVATPLTVAAYVAGLLTLIAAILGKEKPGPDWHPALVASGLLVILIVLAIATTLLSLRNTTIAPATESVGRRRIRQARRSGHRIRQLHRAAIKTRELVGAQPAVRQYTTAQETAHRVRVLSSSTGFLRIDPSRLAQAVSGHRWRLGDVRLDLLVLSGVSVSAGQEIASIVPAAGGDAEEGEIVAVERAFSVEAESLVERCAELCVTLCSQLPLLVHAGDPGGAGRVLEVLLALLDAHLAADPDHDVNDGVPINPVLARTLDQGLAGMRGASSDAEREICGRLLRSLIERSAKDDGVVAYLSSRLTRAKTSAEFTVLYRAGCRAALTGSRLGIFTTQRAFDRLTAGPGETARYANEHAGRLVLYCAAVAPRLSRTAWSSWWGTSGATHPGDHRDLAVRVGAGSLPVGNLSLAVEVALALRRTGVDFDELIAAAHEHDQAAREQFLSESYGRLLGTDAEQRIVDFLEFARSVCAAVPAPG